MLAALAALAVVLSVSGLFNLLGGRAQAGRSSPKQPVATAGGGGKGRVLVVSIAEEERSLDESEQVVAPRQLRPGEVAPRVRSMPCSSFPMPAARAWMWHSAPMSKVGPPADPTGLSRRVSSVFICGSVGWR